MKYELTSNSINWSGRTLYRIRALKDFSNVKAGDIGGYVESLYNLSQEGNCWIYNQAKVYNKARVFSNARVLGNARVYDNAKVAGDAKICGYAQVYDNAQVYDDARVFSNARVLGYARVYDNAKVSGDAKICGNAQVYAYAHITTGVVNSGMVCEQIESDNDEEDIMYNLSKYYEVE